MGLFNYRPPRTTEPRELLLWYKNITNFVNNPSVEAGNIVGALTGSQIGAGTISLDKFLAGLRPVQVITSLPSLPNSTYPQGAVVFLTSDNKLYRSTGSAWTAVIPTTDLDGTITETQIADDSISTPKLKANIVTTAKLAAGAVTANELAANSVIAGKISAGAVTTDKMIVANWTNNIPNGNFATGDFTNWRPYSTPGNISIIVPSFVPASYAARFSNDGGVGSVSMFSHAKAYSDPGAQYDGVQCQPGEQYRISFYAVKHSSYSGNLDVYVFYRKADGSYNNYMSLVSGLALTTSWVEYAYDFIVPSDATTFYLYWYTTSFAAGNWHLTNVRCRRENDADLIVDGAIRTSKIYSGLYTPPGDNNSVPGAGMKLDVDGGKIEAYGDSHSFGGNFVSSDGNYMISTGRYLTATGLAKRYPLQNSTNFTADGQIHLYKWSVNTWVELANFGYKLTGGSDYAIGYFNAIGLSNTAAVYGAADYTTGQAVRGNHSGSGMGYGVYGAANNGYGLFGSGGLGPIYLYPSVSASAPTHSAALGTLWVTSAGVLYINTSGSTTWGKVGAQ